MGDPKSLSWQWNGVNFSCLYRAPFDPVFGAKARHIDEPVECATPSDLIACLRANSRAEAFAFAKVKDSDRNECEELPERDGLLWCHDESPDTGPGG